MGEMAAGLSKMRALAKLLTGLAEVLPTVLWDKNNPDFGVRRMTESELSLWTSITNKLFLCANKLFRIWHFFTSLFLV